MEQIMKQLLGQNDVSRTAAEQTISELEKHPEEYLLSLLTVGSVPVRRKK